MAVEIKEEIRGENTAQPAQGVPERPLHPMQLQVSPEMQETIVNIVDADYDKFKEDKDNRDYGYSSKGEKLGFEQWFKELKDLYKAHRLPKTEPWKYCSNRSLRITASIIDMMIARFYPNIVNESLTKWKSQKAVNTPKVERIDKLMRWWMWIRSGMRTFFDNWVKVQTALGDCIVETTYQIKPKKIKTVQNQIKLEGGGDLGTANQAEIVDMEERTHSRAYTRDMYYMQKGAKDLQSDPVILEDTFLYRELEEGEVLGRFVNITTILKEKIPVEEAEPSNLPPEEAQRLRDIKLRNKPVRVFKEYMKLDINRDGFAEQVVVYTSPEHKVYLGGIACDNLTKSGERPLDFCKFDSRLDNPDENWGEGVIEKVKELAMEIDAIFNQLTDLNTLSIMRPIFYDPNGQLDVPNLTLHPNRMTPVPDPARNVYIPDLKVQIDHLIMAIRLVLEFVERLTAASSYVLGKESEIVGGSGTATRTNAIMQSASQRLALPAERMRYYASRIIRRHLDVLQLFIPPGLEQRVLGEKGEQVFKVNELTEEGISGEFDCSILPDPTFGSKDTERELAGMFYSVLMQNPLVGTDPLKIYKVTADLLKSYDKRPEDYLGPAPMEDDIDSPDDENTLMVQGDFGRVRAQMAENHIEHIMKHQQFLESPSLQALTQQAPNLGREVLTYAQQHVMEHMQMMQAMMGLVAKLGGGKPGGGKPSGEQQGEGPASKGAGGPTGMETVSGPLASAMQTKQQGKAGGPPSG